MPTVRAKQLGDYLRAAGATELHPAFREYFYYSRRALFNPLFALIGTALAGFAYGLHYRAGILAGIACVIFGSYLWLRTRSIARGIQLRRTAPKLATELDKIRVEYVVENASSFAASDLVFRDLFSGSLGNEVADWIQDELPAFGSLTRSYTRVCDSGMGDFKFGPMSLVVTDPLGMFEFTVTEEVEHRMRVEPKLLHLPELPFRGSRESHQFGSYDVPTAGSSVNFIGIREYSRGDSLRHVSWKLSARLSRLVVKEFEKSVNTDITLIVDMNASRHAGRKSESTWEYAKDLALGLLASQAGNGNGLQLLSNSAWFPMGRSPLQAHTLSRAVSTLRPVADTDERNLVTRQIALIPPASTVIYIGPVLADEDVALLDTLAALQLDNRQVFCFLIDGQSFIRGQIQSVLKQAFDIQAEQGARSLAASVERLAKGGIRATVIARGNDIPQRVLETEASL